MFVLLKQMLKEKNMIVERATVAEKENFEEEEQQKEVVKVLEGEKKKRKALRVGSEGKDVKAMQVCLAFLERRVFCLIIVLELCRVYV